MTNVIFWEKPGCISNRRQKALLEASGHRLDIRNLLTTGWSPETLRPFFGNMAIAEWFNASAPQVKAGEIDPARLGEAEALDAMAANPILIRRPLMQAGDRRMAGFDQAEVDAWLGLAPTEETVTDSCPKIVHAPCP